MYDLCIIIIIILAPEVEALRAGRKKERLKLVLWRRPVPTVHYFLWELLYEAQRLTYGYNIHTDATHYYCVLCESFLLFHSILQHKVKVTLSILILVIYLASHYLDGPHRNVSLWYNTIPSLEEKD